MPSTTFNRGYQDRHRTARESTQQQKRAAENRFRISTSLLGFGQLTAFLFCAH